MKRSLLIPAAVTFLISLPTQAGQYITEVDWATLRDMLAQEAQSVRNSLARAEGTYQDLLAVKAGMSNADFCKQLYAVDPCSQAQLDTVADAVAAGTALHQLYGAATNEVTTTKDRMSDLRKFLDR